MNMDQNEKEETHQEVPRGWFFPVHLISLYQEETINAEELMLLGTVNSLQKAKLGCVASNRWLAKKWNKTRDHVSGTISKLTKLGLIICEYDENSHRRIFVTFAGDPDPRKKTLTPSEENPRPPRKKTLGHLRRQYKETKIPLCLAPAKPGDQTNGMFQIDPDQDATLSQWSDTLQNFLISTRRFQKSRFSKAHWIRELSKLRDDCDGDTDRIGKVLNAYITKRHDDRTPMADSARSFREKFNKLENWARKGMPIQQVSRVEIIKGKKRVMKKGQTISDIDPSYDQ